MGVSVGVSIHKWVFCEPAVFMYFVVFKSMSVCVRTIVMYHMSIALYVLYIFSIGCHRNHHLLD